MHLAANIGSVPVLEVLTARKLDFSLENHNGDTPFSLAMGHSHVAAVDFISAIRSGLSSSTEP